MRVPCLLGNYGTGFVILTATINDSYDEIEFSVSVNQSLPKNPATKSWFTVLGEIISKNNIIQYVNTVPVIIIGEECE